MDFDIMIFLQDLKSRLKVFDLKGAAECAEKFISFLKQSDDAIPLNIAEKILQQFRSKRMFTQMQRIADTLIQTSRISFKIQKQYAQSMIDSGNYTAALAVLQSLITDTNNAHMQDINAITENFEAKGLIGRVYKQLYVNAGNPKNPQCVHYLSLSMDAYYSVYKADANKVWHGINSVAVIERAKRDKLEIQDLPDSRGLAEKILFLIDKRYKAKRADAWDFATAAEACVALNEPEEALKWLSGYARMDDCDAFELASTLRQFEEVWQLDLNTRMGQLLLSILRAELTKRQGSNLILDIETVKKQKAVEGIVTEKYDALIEAQAETVVKKGDGKPKVVLEKVFGADSFKTYKWYMTGADRCLAVARIGKDSTQGFGTGFLLKGNMLKESWSEELVLITNAHVISNDPAEKALKPDEAIVTFEALNGFEEFRELEIIWTSASTILDATILRFKPEDQDRLKKLTQNIKLYPVSKYLPAVEDPPTQKIYIIGHPNGGTLQLSFQDNLLIDHENPKIHYRTPTEGGSSGSPVFNQQWDLIGLHHATSDIMPCLNGKPGTYEANEGLWIQSIIKAL